MQTIREINVQPQFYLLPEAVNKNTTDKGISHTNILLCSKEISSQISGVFHYQSRIKKVCKSQSQNTKLSHILEKQGVSCDIMSWISANIDLQLDNLQALKEEHSSWTESCSGRQWWSSPNQDL